MSWRDFQIHSQEDSKDLDTDPFQDSGEAIKVFFPALNRDVWICADEKAWAMVEDEGLTCLLFIDLQFILQGKQGEDRLNRLFKVCARRHPVTEETLKLFNGKITAMCKKEISQ